MDALSSPSNAAAHVSLPHASSQPPVQMEYRNRVALRPASVQMEYSKKHEHSQAEKFGSVITGRPRIKGQIRTYIPPVSAPFLKSLPPFDEGDRLHLKTQPVSVLLA